MDFQTGALLRTIEEPADLRQLSPTQLPQVADELRQFIIDMVSKKGGHFGASLGVVELTVALHYVFHTPYDQIVWDVGHQAYGHKILTGRRAQFHTNRLQGGLSGFPKRQESVYDAFGVGHASTSISAGLGMSVASRFLGETDRKVVVVIGDGALTGGMAFEALNHAGAAAADLLVIVNDNCMSIDPNVGALKEYLADVAASRTFNTMRDDIRELLGKVSVFGPAVRDLAAKIEVAVKGVLSQKSNLFEGLNFRYFGPIDGHNVVHLEKMLRDLKDIPGPKILHCLTRKGKGYKFSEEGDQTTWHAPGKFEKETGRLLTAPASASQPPKYQDVFGETLLELARSNTRIMAITPAMLSGSSLKMMQAVFPDRVFDVGIAEQHAVTFSAGLATRGLVPFCVIYSSFLQRAYDQVIHDVALQNLKVVFCIDRAGLVGPDGATHQGVYDIAYLRCIPGLIVSAPMDERELRHFLYTAQTEAVTGPIAIRYPRGQGTLTEWRQPCQSVTIGTGRRLREGTDVAILSLGPIGTTVMRVCDTLKQSGIRAAHYDLRFIKPLDEALLHEVGRNFRTVVTVEDGCILGGMGSAVLEYLTDHGYTGRIKRLGIPDQYIEHGEAKDQYVLCGLDEESLVKSIGTFVKAS
ncbi:MAG: 1-deoxy-D-xylulose-5-phosphate synthase [Candidatus Moranbacteria bacterium]|jgi:1-deoxy-D-xylulose-5-phosphate synthase|nr:1-deoxy-D-xylulose-5-phosphate synthase [Candidatus Moranbacteria bacterium]